MAAVFLKLLNLSISASWLVLAVLVLRLISKRSPKWVNVLLWGIVALRLVLPFSIESALSLIPSAETVSPAAAQFDPAPTITSGVSVIDNAVNPSLSEHFAAVPTASVNPLYVGAYLAGWVWLIGLGAMLLYALVSYLRLRRRVSVSLPIQDHIYLCDAISSPFILGVVKPRIYLPSGLDEVQRQNVLAHEQAHLARRDHWWKPLGFALLAVYWFNPVLWLAYTLLCRDIELACDERVIRTMDESAVKTYSTVLLACSMPRKAVITCPLAFGEVGVKERVRNALHYKKPAFWVVAASVAVCVVVAVCFLTNPPRALSKVCGDFWDTEAVCTYTEEQPGTDARYTTTNGTVRLSEHLALVRIGAARPEKKSAVNPKWSTLYLALPGADGAPAERLTIDFIREYDAPGGTKATYTLNIGTRDDSKSYKVLSGQDEIEAFLAYLRGDTALTASSVSIQKISETAYRNALAEEKTSTAWDGRNSSPVCPERGTADARVLTFYELAVVPPCVYVRKGHPLTQLEHVSEADLEGYPYSSFEQAQGVAVDFSEELPMVSMRKPSKAIIVNNRSTAMNVLANTDAYSTGSGLLAEHLSPANVVTIPLTDKDPVRLGWIYPQNAKLSSHAEGFVRLLEQSIQRSIAYTSSLHRQIVGK